MKSTSDEARGSGAGSRRGIAEAGDPGEASRTREGSGDCGRVPETAETKQITDLDAWSVLQPWNSTSAQAVRLQQADQKHASLPMEQNYDPEDAIRTRTQASEVKRIAGYNRPQWREFEVRALILVKQYRAKVL